MFKYYTKIAIRNFLKYKSYFFISLFGLSFGLAVSIMLLLYVQNELSYDRYNENAENIYRLCQINHAYHAPQTAKVLADGIPEIEDYGRMLVTGPTILEYGEHKFKEKGNDIIYADPSIFRIFSFDFISGDPESVLDNPYSMVISELIAHKYFGEENPVGKVIKINNETDYTISGVIENMPSTSHFRYDIFFTLTGEDELFGGLTKNWGWQNFLIYFIMQDDFSKDEVSTKAEELIIRSANLGPDDQKPVYNLQQLKDIHLHSGHIENDIQPQNSFSYVLIFAGIAILILFIACFNYINLFTANATARYSEIGIKKVVGVTRRELSTQFMSESFILLLISFFLSLIIIEISLPLMNNLLGKELMVSQLLNAKSILGILAIILITGVLAGSYPAFMLSSVQPNKVLKGSSNGAHSRSNIRRILVISQFIIVVALISSAMLMLLQIKYMEKKELGFNKENIIVAEFEDFTDIEKFKTFKRALLEQNFVLDVSAGSRIPSGELNNIGVLIQEGEKDYNLPIVHVSFDYFETLGINAKIGRTFSDAIQTDIDNALVLNESAAKQLKFNEGVVGKRINFAWPFSNREIIGVVNDFHFESLYKKIQPTAFVIYYEQCSRLMLKIQSSDIGNSIKRVNNICTEFYPDLIFEFHTMDEQLENAYREDKRTFNLMAYFTLLAILIACVGLFGLASFMLKRRTKEIGMRKVFGSGLLQLMINLSKNFAYWVVIACVIAWPLSWIMIRKWLEGFAYSIDIGIWVFIISGIITLILALATVCWLSWKVASKNPVDALRYE